MSALEWTLNRGVRLFLNKIIHDFDFKKDFLSSECILFDPPTKCLINSLWALIRDVCLVIQNYYSMGAFETCAYPRRALIQDVS